MCNLSSRHGINIGWMEEEMKELIGICVCYLLPTMQVD